MIAFIYFIISQHNKRGYMNLREDLLNQFKVSNNQLAAEVENLKHRLKKQKEASREHEALIDKLNRRITELESNYDTALEGNEQLYKSLKEQSLTTAKLINILEKVVSNER